MGVRSIESTKTRAAQGGLAVSKLAASGGAPIDEFRRILGCPELAVLADSCPERRLRAPGAVDGDRRENGFGPRMDTDAHG